MSEVNGRQWLQLGGWVFRWAEDRPQSGVGRSGRRGRGGGLNEGVCKDLFRGQEDRTGCLCASAGRGKNNIMCCCLLLTTSSTVIASL